MLKEFLGTCSKFDISFDCRSCHSNYKTGRLKMRDWNYRHQTAGGGKCSYDTTALLLLISYTMQRFIDCVLCDDFQIPNVQSPEVFFCGWLFASAKYETIDPSLCSTSGGVESLLCCFRLRNLSSFVHGI